MQSLPPALRQRLLVEVDDIASDAMLAELGTKSLWDTVSQFHRMPPSANADALMTPLPDQIVLYRLPLLLRWIETGEDLYDLVRSVTLEEVGHNFDIPFDNKPLPPGTVRPPSAEYLLRLGRNAVQVLPTELRQRAPGLKVKVQDIGNDTTVAELGVASPWDLVSLYQGLPQGMDPDALMAPMPDHVVLFRLPLLLEWIECRNNLTALVESVMLHEVAYHQGCEVNALQSL